MARSPGRATRLTEGLPDYTRKLEPSLMIYRDARHWSVPVCLIGVILGSLAPALRAAEAALTCPQ